MAEFRLDELVRRSGVSARNIRSYQERRLLRPPRREGRVAIYDGDHLVQLQIIAQLLQKGFSVSHIQEFFDGLARNLDLADILGIRELAQKTGFLQALTAPWGKAPTRSGTAPLPLTVDPSSRVARTLLSRGVAEQQDAQLVITDPDIAAALAVFKDQAFGLRILAGVFEATTEAVEQVADATIEEVGKNLVEQYGEGWTPPIEDQQELDAVIADVRELARQALTRSLRNALRNKGIAMQAGIVTDFIKAISGESPPS